MTLRISGTSDEVLDDVVKQLGVGPVPTRSVRWSPVVNRALVPYDRNGKRLPTDSMQNKMWLDFSDREKIKITQGAKQPVCLHPHHNPFTLAPHPYPPPLPFTLTLHPHHNPHHNPYPHFHPHHHHNPIGHNIQGAKQPVYLHIGRKKPYKGRAPGLGHGIVIKRENTHWVLNVDGATMRLGVWWLESAQRGIIDALPVVNISPQFESNNCENSLKFKAKVAAKDKDSTRDRMKTNPSNEGKASSSSV
jgi:hypothetical protein